MAELLEHNETASMDRVKYAFGRYMERFHQFLAPSTSASLEWTQRPYSKAVYIASDRMIDATEQLLSQYRKDGNPALPVILMAFDKELMNIPASFSRQIADPQWVQLPADDKGRYFKMRQIQQQRRVQLAFIAPTSSTAQEMAAQFARTYIEMTGNDRMMAQYELMGLPMEQPIMIMRDDVELSNAAPEEKNLTILLLDLQLRETVPIFTFPDIDNPVADGRGSNNSDDPSGYSTVRNIIVQEVGSDGVTRINVEEVTHHDLSAGGGSQLCG